ncbi:aqualysin-1-like [Saccoglossus kowalevskii]|uniref:Cuticle-degrading serine protease-like n=1 Tax=Saccoglossus kowalevskii TaxID=10224 RepID=A0ABM0M7F4_SACKO|nr:PREDICTED: cuticle-degrading serine protease-like [Saccoglossus kowalevskii]
MRVVLLLSLASIAAAYQYIEGEVTWNIDRLDETKPVWPNWNKDLADYDPFDTGAGTVVYIVGTGIHNVHNNFGPGLIRQSVTYDFDPDNVPQGQDTDGRGTMLSGVVGGSYTGAAAGVELSTVRVTADPSYQNLNGTYLIEGMQAIVDDYINRKTLNPTNYLRGVALGGMWFDVATLDPALLDVVENLVDEMVANDLVVVVNVGMGNQTNCTNFTPGRMYETEGIIAVGGVDRLDYKSPLSNYGECAELWAPMEDIWSSSIDFNDTARVDYYATSEPDISYASAHVAGVTAIVRGHCPDAPNNVIAAIVRNMAIENGGTALMPGTDEELGPVVRVPTTKEVDYIPACSL